MKERVLAARYARGIFWIASETGEVTRLMQDMRALKEACAKVPHLVKGLSDEGVDIERRLSAAREIGTKLKLGEQTMDALSFLIRRRRAKLLPLVVEEALGIAAVSEGVAFAKLTVADGREAEGIKDGVEGILSDALASKVICHVDVDPSLIGGFEIKVGDMRFDASVSGKLSRMKELLSEGAEEF